MSLVITATSRQAFSLSCHQKPSSAKVVSLPQYLDNACPAKSYTILSDIEVEAIFEVIISKWCKANNKQIANIKATAVSARKAFDFFVNYKLKSYSDADTPSVESLAMTQWAKTFVEWIGKNNKLTYALHQASQIQHVMNAVQDFSDLKFYGFFGENKVVRDFIKEASLRGATNLSMPYHDIVPEKKSYQTMQGELVAAARWAKMRREQGDKSIGIVLPNLRNHRELVKRIFDSELCNASDMIPLIESQRPYRFTLGTPVSSYPSSKALLFVLGFKTMGSNAFADVSSLLRNPCLFGAKLERLPRAKLEMEIRRIGANKIGFDTLVNLAQTDMASGQPALFHCPELASRLLNQRDLMSSMPSKMPHSEFVRVVVSLAAIWDIDTTPLDAEGGVLDALRNLDVTNTKVSFGQGLARLKAMMANATYQAPSGAQDIQILTESEALGLHFDALWFAGLTSSAWPLSPRPSPFIDRGIQVSANIPSSCADVELLYATGVSHHLSFCAKHVVLSAHLSHGDAVFTPSSIMEMTGKATVDIDPTSHTLLKAKEALLCEKESFDDSLALPVDSGDVVLGGTGLFKSQSACPFKGFVENRLGIRELRDPETGLSASLRGDVLHAVLEKFWKDVGDSESLRALVLRPDGLLRKVKESVMYALNAAARYKPDVFTQRMIEIESKRLVSLVMGWMESIELARGDFKGVEVELSRPVRIGDIEINVKMDHCDYTESGAVNIADNKSGEVTPNSWSGERLLDPQLPIYALSEFDAGKTINSVVFKQIKNGNLKVKGLVAEGDTYPQLKKPEDIPQVIEQWREKLEVLAKEFRDGVANVSPFVDSVCTYCALKPACRHHMSLSL